MRRRTLTVLLVAATGVCPAGASAASGTIVSGPVSVALEADPPRLTLTQQGGAPLAGAGAVFSAVDAGGRRDATAVRDLRSSGGAVQATVLLAGGRSLALRIAPRGEGNVEILVRAGSDVTSVGAAWRLAAGDQLLGTGERSDAVDRRGRETENYVADGPFRAGGPPLRRRPRRRRGPRATATTRRTSRSRGCCSARGWGVPIDEDETSRFARAARRLARRRPTARGCGCACSPARTPADALRPLHRRRPAASPRRRRRGRSGRGSRPGSRTWSRVEEERAITKAQRDARRAGLGRRDADALPAVRRARGPRATPSASAPTPSTATASPGSSTSTRCCASPTARSTAARPRRGVLQKRPGGAPFAYPAFVGGAAPLGFTLGAARPVRLHRTRRPRTSTRAWCARRSTSAPTAGWRTSASRRRRRSSSTTARTGEAAHNRYPRRLPLRAAADRRGASTARSCASSARAGRARPRCADVVWGGDPTTVWGFDGLSLRGHPAAQRPACRGSRAGVPTSAATTRSAPARRGQAGRDRGRAADARDARRAGSSSARCVPVMRTKRSGLAVPVLRRARRSTTPSTCRCGGGSPSCTTQLNRYLRAADDELPAHGPADRPPPRARATRAARRRARCDDQYLLGPDLLAAPVLGPGEGRAPGVAAAGGGWVDWWSVDALRVRDGAFDLGRHAVLRGGRGSRCPAPLGRPPLLLRVGAVLPLLDPADRHAHGLRRGARARAPGRPPRPPAPGRPPARQHALAARGRARARARSRVAAAGPCRCAPARAPASSCRPRCGPCGDPSGHAASSSTAAHWPARAGATPRGRACSA